MRLQRDEWLSQVMRREVYRAVLPPGPPGNVQPLTADALVTVAGGKDAFFYAKLPADNIGISLRLQEAGFYTVEGSLIFERPVKPALRAVKTAVAVRQAASSDKEQVLDIAGRCFTRTRFYMDPNIPHEVAAEIKRQWAANYFSGARGERIYSAHLSGRCVGFLAALGGADKDGRKVRCIDLVGVDPDFQGKGAGRELVRQYIADAIGRYDLLRLGTQLCNVPAARLYLATGFKIADSQWVLHAHVRSGKVVR
ncbi:MAG: GNAT family N-acetyltransferase [Planctomycetes bacterium]|nr:GNAT family N-acetyltransferase [Planctomycetota bacterium]